MKIFINIALFVMITGVAFSAAPIQNMLTIEAPFVTLKDIFPNAPDKVAKTQVLITPQPGQSVVLNQIWLSSVAKKHGIDYIPQSNMDSIKLVGASDIVTIEETETIVRDHLTQIIKNDAFMVKLDNVDLKLHFPKGKPGDILVTNADVNSQQTRFHATLCLQYEGKEINRVKVNGRIQTMIAVPMLTRAIHRGETIQAEDIQWQNLPSNQISQTTVLDETQLIGAMPRKQEVFPGKPLSKNDVSIPNLVSKNQAVTIYAESPFINITAKGKALENGTKNSYIKVMNTESQKTFHATVIGSQKVRVDIPSIQTVEDSE